ncbi:hypothetical protein FOL47_001317 [Perkinsus chesapeaki]|uniref:Uncharacterized protein n=1 Tax=Perkinsus chesapeaki TaxID=330153 RepID=A0A7J6MKJ0_PERCH|nr:hypothetical protein FOL47_001317 [Perkinsus chesapeaki]
MSLVGRRSVDTEEVREDKVEERRSMEDINSVRPEDADLTAEEVAANCAKALAALKGRRESERMEKEAWATLKKEKADRRDSGEQSSRAREKQNNGVDATHGNGSSSSMGSSLVLTPRRRSNLETEECEDAKRMREMLQKQWHLLWMVDAMNQHRLAAAAAAGLDNAEDTAAMSSTNDAQKGEGRRRHTEEELDTMEYAIALATAAPEYAAAIANCGRQVCDDEVVEEEEFVGTSGTPFFKLGTYLLSLFIIKRLVVGVESTVEEGNLRLAAKPKRIALKSLLWTLAM